MSDEKKDSGFRGRIDRFFDKQAKEQQNLLQGKVGETSIKESWEEVKSKVEKEDLPIENKQVYQELNPDKITKLLIEIDKQTEELNNVREELNISEDMLKFVVELLIKEGFIKNDKLNSTSNFVKKYSTPQKQKHKNVSNG